MIMSEQTIPIPGRLKNVAIGGHVAGSEDIDAGEGKTQKQVNDETNATLALHQSEISGLNSQNYVSVSAYSSLPATGAVDTIYRVSSYDGTQVDATKYAEYAWNGSAYVLLDVKTQVGEVFDISQYKAVGGTLATFDNLSAALDSGNNVPVGVRKGGMSVKYVQSSDNKYVQYMYHGTSTTVVDFTNIDNWEKINLSIEINQLLQKISVSFDYQDRYIKINGTMSDVGTQNWWITGFISILPTSRVKGKIYTMNGVLCVAFYDKDKHFISGVQSDSNSYEWKDIDTFAPENAYYIVGGERRSSSADSILFITTPMNNNKAIDWNEIVNKVRTVVTDNNPEKKSFTLKSPISSDKTIIVNSYNLDDSQYSNLIFQHPNGFVNLRATNVELLDNQVLVLSQSSQSLQRFTSISDLPSSGVSADVYLYPMDFAGFRTLPWDAIFLNSEGNLINLTYSNVQLSANGVPSNEDIEKGLFVKVSLSEDGYIDTDGVFHSTASWKSSDYIKVQPGSRIIGSLYGMTETTLLVAYYDSFYNLVDGISPTVTGNNTFNSIIPIGVSFVRFCNKGTFTSGSVYIGSAIFQKNNDILKYGHNLYKPFDFNGKTAVFFGDSVTNGVASTPTTLIGIEDCYRKIFCDKAGLICTNRAISGSYLYYPNYDGETPDSDSILSQVRQYITSQSNYDFIFIAGGINDYWTGKNLGTLDDNGNISVYGALKAICEHLNTYAPNSIVIFLTPINYSKYKNATPYLPLSNYRNAIFEVATMNGFNVVDMSVIGFPNEPDDSAYKAVTIRDGVHPTEFGHKMMGEMLYSILS